MLATCEAGGATAVVCALEVHNDVPEVYSEGCRALANLAFHPEEDAVEKEGCTDAPEWQRVGKEAVEAALAAQATQTAAARARALEKLALKALGREDEATPDAPPPPAPPPRYPRAPPGGIGRLGGTRAHVPWRRRPCPWSAKRSATS